MEYLFTSIGRAMEATPAVAVAAAVVWGIFSIVLSPCHLASIPLIVAFIDRQGRASARRALVISAAFAFGILATIGAIGAITAGAGRLMGDVGPWANYIVAAIFFAVGLHLMDILPIPFGGPGQVAFQRKGILAALILGLVFGIALGPCTFAFMAPVLGVVFKIGASSWHYGAALLLAYGLGHCAVIVAAGTSTSLVQKYLNWNETSKGAVLLRRACGALVLIGGLYLVYVAP